MLSLILSAGIPMAYVTVFIITGRFMYRCWRNGGKWSMHNSSDAAFFAAIAGIFWPAVWVVIGIATAITMKQPPTAAEERVLREKAELRATTAELALAQATTAANNASSHHREAVRD